MAREREKRMHPEVKNVTIFVEGLVEGPMKKVRDDLDSLDIPLKSIEDISFTRGGIAALMVKKTEEKTVKTAIGNVDEMRVLEEYNPLLNAWAPRMGIHPIGVEAFRTRSTPLKWKK